MLRSKREKVNSMDLVFGFAAVCNRLNKRLYADDDGHFGAECFGCRSHKH